MGQPSFFKLSPTMSLVMLSCVISDCVLSGCATLVTDPVAELLVESEPQGAEVYMRGRLLGLTPLKVFVSSKPGKRRREYVHLKKAGFQPSKTLALKSETNPYLFGNIVFSLTTSGLPSSGIDKASGHSSYFASNALVVELSPQSTPMAPPPDAPSISERRAQEARRDRERLKRAEIRARKEEERRLAHERAVLEAQNRAAQQQASLEAQRSQDKERLEREAKARAQREALEKELKASRDQLKREREERDKAEKAKKEREALEAQLKEAREALEREREELQREREALKKAREALTAPSSSAQGGAPSSPSPAQSKGAQGASGSPLQGAQGAQGAQGSKSGEGSAQERTKDKAQEEEKDEQIDELERRLLKRLREQQRRLEEEEEERRGRGRLTPPQGLPLFELTPVQGSLLSPSWGALTLSVERFNALTLELATLSPTSSPLTRSLFLRLWGAKDATLRAQGHAPLSEEDGWRAYLRFIERAGAERASLLKAPHGLALYRALRRLAFDEEICHSTPTLSAERASPRASEPPSALTQPLN